MRAMEDEAEKLKQLQTEVDKQLNVPTSPTAAVTNLSFEEKMEVDARSVYCGKFLSSLMNCVCLGRYLCFNYRHCFNS